ncbi:MAG: hypothetical protein WAM30_19970 [Candidatus Dormiibacterota bacterium]
MLAEFALAVLLAAVVGALLIRSGGTINTIIAAWALGVAANYLALAAHGVSLCRSGELDRELAGIDFWPGARYCSRAQFLIAVPMLLAVLAIAQLRSRPPESE